MKPTIQDIINQARIVLSHIEEIDEDGTVWYHDEDAKHLHNLIDEYETEHQLPR